MIFSSADLRSPSAVNSMFGLLRSPSMDTLRKYLKKLRMEEEVKHTQGIREGEAIRDAVGVRIYSHLAIVPATATLVLA